MMARLTSIVPTTSVRKTGATKANSTIAAPRRDDSLLDLDLCTAQLL
jgi:hypothetical protein